MHGQLLYVLFYVFFIYRRTNPISLHRTYDLQPFLPPYSSPNNFAAFPISFCIPYYLLSNNKSVNVTHQFTSNYVSNKLGPILFPHIYPD